VALIEITQVLHQTQQGGRHRRLENLHSEALNKLYPKLYITRVRVKLLEH